MIQVGIQEGIELTKAEINDKGTLVLTLKQTSEGSMLDSLGSADDSDTGDSEQSYFIWPFKLDEYVTSGADIFQAAKNMRKMFTHILKGYMKTDDINWAPLDGIKIEHEDQVETELVKASNIERLYNNLVSQFIDMVTPYLGKGVKFRVKFVRQSKDKHFSSLPRVNEYTNLTNDPFWESMLVKPEVSRVAFSNYEKGYRKGDADGKPTGVDLSDPTQTMQATEADPEETAAVDEVFGD